MATAGMALRLGAGEPPWKDTCTLHGVCLIGTVLQHQRPWLLRILLPLRFNGHFPGEPVFTEANDDGGGEW